MQISTEHISNHPTEYQNSGVRRLFRGLSPGERFRCPVRAERFFNFLLPMLLSLALCLSGCGSSGAAADSAESPKTTVDKVEELAVRESAADAGMEDGSRALPEGRETEGESPASGTETETAPQDAETEAAHEDVETEAPAAALSPSPAGYTAPDPLVSSFHKDKAEGDNGVLFDLSCAKDGYVGVSAKSSGRLKCQVLKDGQTYTYDLKSDGTPSIYPLQMEDGMYTFRVLENVSGSKYAVLCSKDATISIEDEFRPYLCASDYVSYTDSSACVKKAQELAAGAKDANGLISAVYDFVCASVKYDRDKARNVQAGYMPVPDETLSTGRGICFDYASLAAAMLRSQGIPCKVIFGYVSPNEVYHAWNMFYTQENGWVTASFEIKGKTWNRLDLTFSSNGADGNFIGDGGNYKDVYYY